MPLYGSSSSRGYAHMHTQYREFIKEQYPQCRVIVTGGKQFDPLPNNLGREYTIINREPNWRLYPKNKHGYRAFAERNKEIAKADVLIALWDGKSRGTKMTIDFARRAGKRVDIWTVKDGAIIPYLSTQRTLDEVI